MSDHSLLEIILYKPLHVATPHIIIMYDNETTGIQLLHIYYIQTWSEYYLCRYTVKTTQSKENMNYRNQSL